MCWDQIEMVKWREASSLEWSLATFSLQNSMDKCDMHPQLWATGLEGARCQFKRRVVATDSWIHDSWHHVGTWHHRSMWTLIQKNVAELWNKHWSVFSWGEHGGSGRSPGTPLKAAVARIFVISFYLNRFNLEDSGQLFCCDNSCRVTHQANSYF